MTAGTTSGIRQRAEVFAAMLVFWVLLMGSLSPTALGIGVFVAAAIAALSRSSLSFFADFRFTPAAMWATAAYFGFFFRELALANLRLARVILSPSLPINPGFVKVRTRLKTPMGRLLLANSITLTPGTLTVEIEGDWLYVHWVTMDARDVDGATQAIVAGFERYLEVMYG